MEVKTVSSTLACVAMRYMTDRRRARRAWLEQLAGKETRAQLLRVRRLQRSRFPELEHCKVLHCGRLLCVSIRIHPRPENAFIFRIRTRLRTKW